MNNITNFIIEKGIDIPPKRPVGRKPGVKYPFAQMQVGDSFVCPENPKRPGYSLAGPSAVSFKKNNPGWDYTVRKEGDHFRLWRTA
jgi:hypothetical protein